MFENIENLPILNYLWVGSPKQPRIGDLGESIPGSDIRYVLEMANKCRNPVCYYCLDEHVDHYKDLFNGKNVAVKSIDAYLKENLDNSDKKIQEHAATMIKMQNELLHSPRNRIIDKVSFKDAFSLFLLASQGGYTLDTSIKPTNENISLPSYESFRMPYDPNVRDVSANECWMMYASPNALQEPFNKLDNYLKNWEATQNIIRGNDQKTYDKFQGIFHYHNMITSLMIMSIASDQKSRDPDWAYSVSAQTNEPGVTGIAKTAGLPIVKLYGSSHKPELECREIVKANMEYVEKNTAIKNDQRGVLLNNLKDMLRLYEQEKVSDKVQLAQLTNLDNVLEAVKELDQAVEYLNENIIVDNSQNAKLNQSMKEIHHTIDNGYSSLNDRLMNNKYAYSQKLKSPKEIYDNFYENVGEILQKIEENAEEIQAQPSSTAMIADMLQLNENQLNPQQMNNNEDIDFDLLTSGIEPDQIQGVDKSILVRAESAIGQAVRLQNTAEVENENVIEEIKSPTLRGRS